MTDPIRFDPSVEQFKPDEAAVIRGLEEQFDSIQETTAKDYKAGVRAVHAKAHGIAIGRLTVREGLPAQLTQGIFASPVTYEAVAFSIWNDEMTRLLIDLPHDILAHAVDEAIRNTPHGFMPSVGEIRRHAEPLVAEVEHQIERLERMEAALADPIATAERASRRHNQASHARASVGAAR